MGKVIIISATSGNNLTLAGNIKSLLNGLGEACELINLETVDLPLYMPENDGPKETINALTAQLKEPRGIIFCSPEYNGGVPPIITNALAWISVTTEDWRDAFNGKFALICTHSGGPGFRFLRGLRSQLEHLGTNVLARTISVTNQKPLNEDSAKRILQGFIDLV